MKIRIEIEVGTIVVADEFCMPEAHLTQSLEPRALLDHIEAGLWKKMSVAVDKALAKLLVNHKPVQGPGDPHDVRFDVA